MTAVELSGRLADNIREHAAAVHPEEACGILIGRVHAGRVRVRSALPCVNQAPTAARRHRFEIEPRAVLNLQRALRETPHTIVGFYHSHPGSPPMPSRTDLEYFRLWPETVWVIAGMDAHGARLCAWWLDAEATALPRELAIAAPRPRATGCPE